MRFKELIDNIETKEDFLNFIYKLEEDKTLNNSEWENADIASYLEAIGNWIEDMDG